MLRFFKKRKKTTEKEKHSYLIKKEFSFDEIEAKDLLDDIKKEFGLDYKKQKFVTLKKIEKFALQNEIYSFKELLFNIENSTTMKQKLINMLTVGETYFYRETAHFEILSSLIKKKTIKDILVSPCSTGEEAYSILLYLLDNDIDISEVFITGIDLNSDAILSAREGIYSKRSISQLPHHLLTSYFTKQDNNRYKISKTLKDKTLFIYHNIFAKDFIDIGKFDAVFCRNMLIYFEDEKKKEVLDILYQMLNHQGVLFLGHADISFIPENFKKILDDNGIYYIKI